MNFHKSKFNGHVANALPTLNLFVFGMCYGEAARFGFHITIVMVGPCAGFQKRGFSFCYFIAKIIFKSYRTTNTGVFQFLLVPKTWSVLLLV